MSVDESLYAAPDSALDRPIASSARSLEDAIEGRWDFDIMDVLRESWEKTSGAKGAIWVGLLASYAISFAMQFVGIGLGSVLGAESTIGFLIVFLLQLAGQMAVFVLTAGLYQYAIKWSAGDATAEANDIFSAFSKAGPIIALWLLMVIMIVVGLALFVLPGIYLAVAYTLGVPLVLERGLGPWEALETSRKAISNHWFKVVGLFFVSGVALTLGIVLTLGIGMIWAMPCFFILYGVLYNRIFGYSGAGGSAG